MNVAKMEISLILAVLCFIWSVSSESKESQELDENELTSMPGITVRTTEKMVNDRDTVSTTIPNEKSLLMNTERMPVPKEIKITPSLDDEVCWDFEKKYCEQLSEVLNISSDCQGDDYCVYISEVGKCCNIPCDDTPKKCRFPVDNQDLVDSFLPESDRDFAIASTL